MQSLTRYSPAVARLVVLLFFLANAGFLLPLTYCTMHCEACSAAGGGLNSACRQNAQERQQESAGAASLSAVSCMVATLAGGLPGIPTIVEKESWQRPDRAEITIASPVSLASTVTVRPLQQRFPAAVCDVSAPPVETYVLNATFLI